MRAPSFLKGYCDNDCVDKMAEAFAKVERHVHSNIWISRVPSKSNVADPPSRGILQTAELATAIDVSELAKQKLEELVAQYFEVGGDG